MEFKTVSSTQTKKIAGLLAKEILASSSHFCNALVLALVGNLGSGKTTFIQGFLRGLGIKNKITSPTFVIAKKYKFPSFASINSGFTSNGKVMAGKKTINYKRAWHFDCYRIRKPTELFNLGFKEILSDPENIILIEWPEVIKKVLPKNSIWIKFKHGEKENKRTINFRNV